MSKAANKVMSYRTFRRRVAHNTSVLKTAIANGDALITILPKLYTWTSKPGELHSSVLVRNAHDMLPAAYLGLLVNIDANGIDAYSVKYDGTVVYYELKTSEIRSSKIWQGPQGGLYIGVPGNKNKYSGVTSAMGARYGDLTENVLESKRMKTILLVCDTDGSDGYFDAFELAPDTIMDKINGRVGSVHIKLGSFINSGVRAKTVVNVEGFENWRNRIRNSAPVYSTK